MKFNKEEPYFVLYINVSGLSRIRAEEKFSEAIHSFPEGTQVYFLPTTDKTSFECVYGGSYDGLNDKYKESYNYFSDYLESIFNQVKDDDNETKTSEWYLSIKYFLREKKLEDLLNQ